LIEFSKIRVGLLRKGEKENEGGENDEEM